MCEGAFIHKTKPIRPKGIAGNWTNGVTSIYNIVKKSTSSKKIHLKLIKPQSKLENPSAMLGFLQIFFLEGVSFSLILWFP